MTSEAEATRFRAQRKSTLESVDQAAGIFSLYGAPRDSWAPEAGDSEFMEEVDEPRERSSGASWAGPLGALRSGDRDSSHLRSVSSSSTSLGPPITITADNSPEKPALQSLVLSDGLERNRLSPSPSPVTGAMTMFGNNQSQSSLASTRHPGEEPDAFHVRSTYARLEVDGVYGDGWDEGVERTRERAQAHKRQTLHLSEKGDRVGEKERQVLASLDRYGFVMESLKTRSESRLALLPSAPLLKIPKLAQRSSLSGAPRTTPLPTSHGPGGGIEEPPPKTPPMTPARSSKDKAKETERIGKWEKMLNVQERDEGGNVREWGWNPQAGAKLHRRVYKGIPDRWRMAAWWTLIQDTAARRSGGKGKQKENVERLEEDYRHAMDLPSTFDVQIDLDVPRTISGHVMFHTRYGQGQRSLFHVLHCFSMLCPDCGYCQGMGPIAATLLCYFDPERAYALLVEIHNSYNMHSVFAPGFPGLLEAIYVQERLMEFLVPEVYTAFQTHMISGTSYATKWYITLFSNTVPFRTQLRLWDALFLDGQDVMVMMSFSIIWAFKDSLSSKHANFETILSLLSSYFVPEDEDALLRWIRKMLTQPGFKARLTGWRTDWQRLKDTGEADKALL